MKRLSFLFLHPKNGKSVIQASIEGTLVTCTTHVLDFAVKDLSYWSLTSQVYEESKTR